MTVNKTREDKIVMFYVRLRMQNVMQFIYFEGLKIQVSAIIVFVFNILNSSYYMIYYNH